MSDRLLQLCSEIARERNPLVISRLIEELRDLLREEQAAIRREIQRRIGRYVGEIS